MASDGRGPDGRLDPLDTAVVLRRRVRYTSGGGEPGPPVEYEDWEYWWAHPPGLLWNLEDVLRALGVPDDLLSDLMDHLGPSSREYQALVELARSASERVRLRVQVVDAPSGWEPPAEWETISRPRDEYLHLWRVVRAPDTQALQDALQVARRSVEAYRRYGGWL